MPALVRGGKWPVSSLLYLHIREVGLRERAFLALRIFDTECYESGMRFDRRAIYDLSFRSLFFRRLLNSIAQTLHAARECRLSVGALRSTP